MFFNTLRVKMFLFWCIIFTSGIFMSYIFPQEHKKCGENEYYSTCTSACGLTCENWAHPPKFCEKLCVARCTCIEDSVEYSGRCIPRKKCPKFPMCYDNETFHQDGGYDCANCRNYKSVECRYIARPGCYCKSGYIRNIVGEDCVLVKDCPLDSLCQENQTYQEGGYDCASCGNLRLISCQFKNKAGCYCKPDYVWNPDAQECILVKDCPENNV